MAYRTLEFHSPEIFHFSNLPRREIPAITVYVMKHSEIYYFNLKSNHLDKSYNQQLVQSSHGGTLKKYEYSHSVRAFNSILSALTNALDEFDKKRAINENVLIFMQF